MINIIIEDLILSIISYHINSYLNPVKVEQKDKINFIYIEPSL